MASRLNHFEQFLILFERLKAVAGEPQRLASFYAESSAIRDIVEQIEDFVGRSGQFERRVFLFGAKRYSQVPPGFEQAWLEYKTQWVHAIANSQLSDLIGERLEYAPQSPKAPEDPETDSPDPEQEEAFDPRFHDGGSALRLGIDHLFTEHDAYSEQVQLGVSDDYAKRTANSCRIALDAFDYLASVIGIDLDAVFRRWRRVPVIFMPPAISNKHGDEKGSINALLDDAVRAFVCGAPAAAITLCRAVAEMIIREYYLPDPKDRWKLTRDGKPMLRRDGTPQEKGLGELIVLASKRYESAEWRKVTRLKDSADGILHRQSSNEPFTERDERIILDFMTTLKSLIGRAPEK